MAAIFNLCCSFNKDEPNFQSNALKKRNVSLPFAQQSSAMIELIRPWFVRHWSYIVIEEEPCCNAGRCADAVRMPDASTNNHASSATSRMHMMQP
jgi:hypothetical protein